jgi:probable rRNA maturation factor
MPVPSSKSKVCFYFQKREIVLTKRKEMKKYIQYIFKKEGRDLKYLNCVFCTDKTLLEINQQYLKHDFYTDILTFDLSETKAIQAEIYISVDRVRENARLFDASFKSELLRVIFHGVLHLCGYEDKKRAQKEEMRTKEEFYLNKYGL